MGKLGTLAIVATLGAWVPTTFADPPDTANPPAKTESTPSSAMAPEPGTAKPAEASTRPDPPAPPRQYLEAGARLFNERRYELATKYLNAANRYRDRLTASERVVLDVYLDNLDEYRRQLQAASASAPAPSSAAVGETREKRGTKGVDVGVAPASTGSAGVDVVRELSRNPVVPTDVPLDPAGSTATANPAAAPSHMRLDRGSVYGTTAWRDSASKKEKARWLMQFAREQIFKGHLEVAEQAIAEARAMDVKWTVFDETPERATEALEKARAKKTKEGTNASDGPHDRRAAKARLRDARAALAAGNLDRAETIAREVKSWGLVFMFFDDSPDKVTAAVSVVRRRQSERDSEITIKPYPRDLPATGQSIPLQLPPPAAASAAPSGRPDSQ